MQCDSPHCTYSVNNDTVQRAKSQKTVYLRHQQSDSVHTLRFDSTHEYFKSTELRDIERKPYGSAAIFRPQPITSDLIFSVFGHRLSRNQFYMKLCNARIDFKISLGLLSWFIIIRKIAFWSVLALLIVDPIFSLFFCNVCPQGGVDLYGDGDLLGNVDPETHRFSIKP